MHSFGKNSVVQFHELRIKRYLVLSLMLVICIGITLFILLEAIKHLEWIDSGYLDSSKHNIAIIFYNAIIIDSVIMALLLVYLIAIIVFIVLSFKMIKYYNDAEIINIQRVLIDFDYKLWQLAPKGSFQAMPLTANVDGVEKILLSDKIFTNNEKKGLFKIPTILRSHSYVKDFCYIGYDKKRNMPIILEVEKQ